MNYCQFRNQTIKRMAVTSGGDFTAAWQDIQDTIAYNAGKTYTETVSIIPYKFSGSGFCPSTLCLAPGGIIYGMPYGETHVIKLDTNTDTVSAIGSYANTASKWAGATYCPYNKCIYAFPVLGGSIFKFNTVTETPETFGTYGTTDGQFIGASLAPNGCIYSVPQGNRYILKLDPTDDSITTIDTNNTSANNWNYSAINLDGYMFCPPRSGSTLLRINTNDDTFDTLSFSSGGYQYGQALCGHDGNIYVAEDASNTYKVVIGNTGSSFTRTQIGGNSYCSCVEAPNGVVYFIGSKINNVLRYDIVNSTALTRLSSTNAYSGAILAPNGCIYSISANSNFTHGFLKIKIEITGGRNFKESTLLSPFMNRGN